MITLLNVLFGQSKVNYVDEMRVFSHSHQEIVGFYVAMENVLFVEDLYSLDHLLSDLENGFERESLVAIVEEIFEAGAQDVHEHDIVLTFGGEGVDLHRS